MPVAIIYPLIKALMSRFGLPFWKTGAKRSVATMKRRAKFKLKFLNCQEIYQIAGTLRRSLKEPDSMRR